MSKLKILFNIQSQREQRDNQEREDKKRLMREQKQRDKEEEKRRQETAELKLINDKNSFENLFLLSRNYSALMQSDKMRSNKVRSLDFRR